MCRARAERSTNLNPEVASGRLPSLIERAALRREFPDVAFHDFESWAKAQDWNALL
jgi:hypothetical protein